MRDITFIVGDDITISVTISDELAAAILQQDEDYDNGGQASYIIEPEKGL